MESFWKSEPFNSLPFEVFDHIQLGILAINKQDEVIYINPYAENIIGKKSAEVLSKNCFSCYPDGFHLEMAHLQNKVRLEGFSQKYLGYHHGLEQWIEMEIHRSGSNLVCLLKDVTKERLLQEQMENRKWEQHKKLTSAAIRAHENKRAQVSLKLHDDIGQVLTTIKLYQEVLINREAAKEVSEKSLALLQQCIRGVRHLAKELSAPSLGKMHLTETIHELVETIRESGTKNICFNHHGIEKLEVPAEIHLVIYRILQEHLNNISRHAEATAVRVWITYSGEDFLIKITDNGKGFNMYEQNSGIGISHMRSLAISLDGRLSINSRPGLGCVLILQFRL